MQTGVVDPRYAFSETEISILQGTWPADLVLDPKRQPRIVDTPRDFLCEVLIGEHIDDFVILPRGVDLLDLKWEDCIPEDIRQTLLGCSNAHDALTKMLERPHMLQKYRASVVYGCPNREQKEILREDKLNLEKMIHEALDLVRDGKVDPASLYIAEMRMQVATHHPIGGEKVKTVCQRDIKDVLGPYAAWTLYWDRYDEGLFVGGRGSGKGIHVDQFLWSNVGRNWCGYKLVAAWPKGEVSKRVTDEFFGTLLSPPLTEREIEVLHQAAKVVLLRPGDVYAFSGGVAHTVLCISNQACLAAYESFVNLNPASVEHFFHTDEAFFSHAMSSDEFNKTKEDCVDQLEEVAEQLFREGPCKEPGPPGATSATWRKLMAELHQDAELQEKLRRFYAQTVDRCARDSFCESHMSRSVVHAAEACRIGAENVSAAIGIKRRRADQSKTRTSSEKNLEISQV